MFINNTGPSFEFSRLAAAASERFVNGRDCVSTLRARLEREWSRQIGLQRSYIRKDATLRLLLKSTNEFDAAAKGFSEASQLTENNEELVQLANATKSGAYLFLSVEQVHYLSKVIPNPELSIEFGNLTKLIYNSEGRENSLLDPNRFSLKFQYSSAFTIVSILTKKISNEIREFNTVVADRLPASKGIIDLIYIQKRWMEVEKLLRPTEGLGVIYSDLFNPIKVDGIS